MKKNSKPGKKEILPRDGVRKSPKKKIRLAKGHFKMLLENVLDYAIFMLDAKGQIISWSPGAQRLLGYENKDILGKHFSIFYSREDAQKKKPERQLKLALKIGRSEDEGWRIRKDGGKFWANAIITPIHNKKGKLLGFSQVTHDLTWRKRAEDELLKSREALLEGQRLSHLGSWTWNIVADDLVCSDEVFRIFGLKPGEIEPSYSLFIKFLHPDDSLRVDKAVHDALENNASYELECRILTPRGEIRHLQTHGEVFRNSKGKAVRMTGSVLDITERKQNEEALRLSEEQFSTAFENAAIGMAIVALDGKWLKVNRALCTLTGYTAEELSKKTFQDITHPDDLEKDLKNVDLLLDGKISSYDMEKRYFNKAGHIVWVLLSGTLVRDAEGKPLHFIAQIQDITWRRKAEEELRIAFERMEVATRAAKVGIWDMDYTTGKLSWDDQMYLFYGVEKGQPHENCERWEKSIHPEDCARVFQEVEDALKGIKSFESEFRIIRENDKSVRTIRAVGTVLRDERGEPLRMIGSNVDVTRERGRE